MIGTVIDVQVFTREGIQRDKRAQQIIDDELKRYRLDLNDQLRIVEGDAFQRLEKLLIGKVVNGGPKKHRQGHEDRQGLPGRSGQVPLVRHPPGGRRHRPSARSDQGIDRREAPQFDLAFEEKRKKLTQGDELPPGVQKMVKVYLAVKRRLQPGDKMAGRHGNKGVVSKIVPIEDMPYMADGTPADIVLNPLGVPSRMNVGQVLEVHLGWAAKGLGLRIGEMLQAQAKAAELRKFLTRSTTSRAARPRASTTSATTKSCELANNLQAACRSRRRCSTARTKRKSAACWISPIRTTSPSKGMTPSKNQVTMYDGRTGEAFERTVTVGYMHVLKLHHLVDDKMHARSTGPYSLVTQQPLGGKAQFGGQRFGEMEVWALEAYGAIYVLQEMLTVKSDDVNGRTKVYENLVKGDHVIEAGMPESFNVLVKEIRSLGIDIDLERN